MLGRRVEHTTLDIFSQSRLCIVAALALSNVSLISCSCWRSATSLGCYLSSVKHVDGSPRYLIWYPFWKPWATFNQSVNLGCKDLCRSICGRQHFTMWKTCSPRFSCNKQNRLAAHRYFLFVTHVPCFECWFNWQAPLFVKFCQNMFHPSQCTAQQCDHQVLHYFEKQSW